jgi:phospholipid/cholesterol/gamma-HCH transport system ATP-binding protein
MENPDQKAPVEVNGLTKSFGEQRVLNGIDLSVPQGETLAILGRSGTGKSVFLKLLIGLQKPDRGSIQIHGKEITNIDGDRLDAIRRKVGFLFQQAALYDSLTVAENVAFPMSRNTDMSEGDRRERVRSLLSKVGMEKDIGKMPSQISGGMQKRVGLARALALDPDILLLDEPTAGLDPITASEIGELVRKLRAEREITSIIVTHDIHTAKSVANRFVMLHEGRIPIAGTFQDLKGSRDEFVARFVKEAA